MGWRYRKSIKLPLGFRVNLSKKGIGYSYGVKGYRHTIKADGGTRDTYTIPNSGISYVKEDTKKYKEDNKMDTYNMQEDINNTYESQEYTSGSTDNYGIHTKIDMIPVKKITLSKTSKRLIKTIFIYPIAVIFLFFISIIIASIIGRETMDYRLEIVFTACVMLYIPTVIVCIIAISINFFNELYKHDTYLDGLRMHTQQLIKSIHDITYNLDLKSLYEFKNLDNKKLSSYILNSQQMISDCIYTINTHKNNIDECNNIVNNYIEYANIITREDARLLHQLVTGLKSAEYNYYNLKVILNMQYISPAGRNRYNKQYAINRDGLMTIADQIARRNEQLEHERLERERLERERFKREQERIDREFREKVQFEEFKKWKEQQEQAEYNSWKQTRSSNNGDKLSEYLSLFMLSIPFTEKELKEQRNFLLKAFHPDSSTSNEEKRNQYSVKINEAYDYLKNYATK